MMAKRLSTLGILLALSLVLSYIDSLVSAAIPLPGVKLGLANIGILLLICVSRYKNAIALSLVRVILASLLFSGFSGFAMSLAGALFSFAAMFVCQKAGFLGVIGLSAAGGALHNIGQLAAALLLAGTAQILYYFPLLLALGIICGFLTGVAAWSALKNPFLRKALESC